jgi:hypothetical protein
VKSILLIVICLLLQAASASGQNLQVCHRSSNGVDFWFGFMQNAVGDSSLYRDFAPCIPDHFGPLHYGEITVTSELGADFNIFIGPSEKPYGPTRHVPPGSSVSVKFNLDSVKEAIHLKTLNNYPVSVYALNFSEYASDMALIYPTAALGKEYYTMCYNPPNIVRQFKIEPIYWDGYPQYGTARDPKTEFLIVATYDKGPTTVWITPKVTTLDGHMVGKTYTVTLNKGEQYQVFSADTVINSKGGIIGGDLTGSHIVSDHPIALFSGNNWTFVTPVHYSLPGHLYEQMPSLQSWGKKFIAIPFNWRSTCRVLASQDLTQVLVTGLPPLILKKGEHHDITITDPVSIQSNNPILVAQIHGADTEYFGVSNDQPSMVILNPEDQVCESLEFTATGFAAWTNLLDIKCDTSAAWLYWEHGDRIGEITYFNEKTDESNASYYINVVVKDDAVGKILLDGAPISFTPLSPTGYSYAKWVPVSKGSHFIRSTEAGKGFVAYAYGRWGKETRSYAIGFNQDLILDLARTNKLERGKPSLWCLGDSLYAGDGFDNYNWGKEITTPFIYPQTSGWYKVEASTKDGCNLKDSIQLIIDRPVIPFGSVRHYCKGDSTVLDAGSHFVDYLWSPSKDTTQKITVTQPGTYGVVVTDSLGCTAKRDVKVLSVEQPILSFAERDTLVCGKQSVLNIDADSVTFIAERLSDHYIFNSLNVQVPDFGTYPFRIRATDKYTCFTDTVINFGFHKVPSVDFSVDATTCYGYNLGVEYRGDAVRTASDFVWIFGGDTINQGIGIASTIIPLGIKQLSRDLKLVVTEEGCSNFKTLANIKVTPLLQMGVEDSIGCKPFSAQFWAKNTETGSYSWDFGDGSILTGTANPLHIYENYGYYTVKLKVTSIQGCINEVRMDNMIFVPPNPFAAFTLDDKILPNFQHEVNFYNSSTDAINYLWDFGDGTTSQDTDPLHLYSKYGYKTIVLHAFNEYSCADTASRTIQIEFRALFPPNAFSPNATDVIDREFKLSTEGLKTEGYHLVIISRWNDIVFETKNEIKGWDGRMKNGDFAPAGNYVWVLDFVDFLEKTHHQTGTVTLIF